MSNRKKIRHADTMASVEAQDYFGTVYDSMCKHDAFKRLKCGTRLFYVICRVQARSSLGTACLYKHANEYGRTYSNHCFVFPAKHLELYGYDKSNAGKYFNELEKAGFIRKIEKNNHIQKVNVYEFTDAWKNSS